MSDLPSVSPTAATDPVRVLVVDDDPTISSVIQRLLARSKINCDTTANGREALRYIERHKVDVVVTDILMPEVDGYELIPKLRRLAPGIRILAITGNAPAFAFDMHRTARLLGADRVIGKPFELAEMQQAVTELLASSTASKSSPPAAR